MSPPNKCVEPTPGKRRGSRETFGLKLTNDSELRACKQSR
jgi:hypothetical protein